MILNNITAHIMVRDEERFIRQTLRCIFPYIESAIIVDTGSNDLTAKFIIEELKKYPNKDFQFFVKEVKDAKKWDGSHVRKELTDVRNWMMSRTTTKYVLQVDGDEQWTPEGISCLSKDLDTIEKGKYLVGIMAPILWCIDEEYYVDGPFGKTLRVYPSSSEHRGDWPNEFVYVNNIPIMIHDTRCITLEHGFLHQSMVLHPERRPNNGIRHKLKEEHKKLLKV